MRDEFLITRQGKQYVLFAGLLDEAHERGLKSIDTELLQVPDEGNGRVAIVRAVVEMEKVDEPTGEVTGRRFSGIGDASPENVNRTIVPHLICQAETRGKARALRDAVNVGATALEEISEESGEPEPSRRQHQGQRQSRGQGRGRQGSGARTENTPVPINQGRDNARDNSRGTPQGVSEENTQQPRGKPARKSQVDLLKTLAVEMRGEGGVERLEAHIGKSLSQLTHEEADGWIDRLSPEEGANGGG